MGGPNFVMGSLNFSKSASMTEIAQRLAPPRMPIRRTQSYLGVIICSLMAIVFAMILIPVVAGKLFGAAIFLAILVMLFICLAIWLASTDRAADKQSWIDHANEMNRWNLAMAHWDLTFYCPKCDSVHRADTRQVVPSHALDALL
jgi:hypothetical protein